MSAHDHAHDHHPRLQHHFESMQQQFDAGKLGMWLFLATEVLLFGGLFCGYAIYRVNHPELFEFGSEYLDTTLGAINTCVLILSSLTMAYAVTCAQTNRRGMLTLMLSLTLLGAAGFMIIKYIEYTDKFDKGIYPGAKYYEGIPEKYQAKYGVTWPPEQGDAAQETSFRMFGADDLASDARSMVGVAPTPPSGVRGDAVDQYRIDHSVDHDHVKHHLLRDDRPANAHMFFNIYFMMTGLHGIHVVIGGGFIVILLIQSLRGVYSSEYFTPVDLGGLYWHVVDLIWIFLFPLFYLI